MVDKEDFKPGDDYGFSGAADTSLYLPVHRKVHGNRQFGIIAGFRVLCERVFPVP